MDTNGQKRVRGKIMEEKITRKELFQSPAKPTCTQPDTITKKKKKITKKYMT